MADRKQANPTNKNAKNLPKFEEGKYTTFVLSIIGHLVIRKNFVSC